MAQIETFAEFHSRYSTARCPAYKYEHTDRAGLVYKCGAWTSNYHALITPVWGMPAGTNIVGMDNHLYFHPGHLPTEARFFYKMIWSRENLREADKAQNAMYGIRANVGTGEGGMIDTDRCYWSDWEHVLGDPPVIPGDRYARTDAEQIEARRIEWTAVLAAVERCRDYYLQCKAKYKTLPSVAKRLADAAQLAESKRQVHTTFHESANVVRELGKLSVPLDEVKDDAQSYD
ncbi:MAG: hypothetical protein AB7U20_06890 [Planctomycetaceae bacterium]